MKKGFTLIELLAVIVILAIIALIAVPIIINIINESKKESQIKTAELYVEGVIQAVADYQLNNSKKEVNPTECTVKENGNIECDTIEEKLVVKVDGNKATSGIIYFENGKVLSYDNIKIENIYVHKDEQGKITTSTKNKIKSTSFAEDSWETIQQVANLDNPNEYYKVGDTKCVALTGKTTSNDNGCSDGKFLVRIANMSNDDPVCKNNENSKTACGFVIEFVDIIETHNMNAEETSVGGWPVSSMRSYLNTDIFGVLPEELQSAITETKTVSGHGLDDSNANRKDKNWESIDKLYLLSAHEVWSNDFGSDTSYNQTRQLDYYKQQKVTTSNYGEAIKKLNKNNFSWWLRLPNSNHDSNYIYVIHYGNWFNFKANVAYGVSPAFRIG